MPLLTFVFLKYGYCDLGAGFDSVVCLDEEVTVVLNLEIRVVLCAFLVDWFPSFVVGASVAAGPLPDRGADPVPHVRTFWF